MNRRVAAFVLLVLTSASTSARERLDLNGTWQFRLDPEAAGMAQKWYAPNLPFRNAIKVPGAWQAQGVGAPSGILRHHYAGAAWYRRAVDVPASWAGQRITLQIGGAHRRTTVFVNGVELGGHDGFSAPFDFDISGAIRPGAANDIVLLVENPPVIIDASPDKQQAAMPTGMLNYIGNWGGIFGGVAIEASPRTRLGPVLVTSNVQQGTVLFGVEVQASGSSSATSVRVRVPGAAPVLARTTSRRADVRVPLPASMQWTPDNPQLLVASIELLEGDKLLDSIEQRFGYREITTQGRNLLLNGKPIYLRGYGDDNVEVLSGFPPSSRAVFIERLRRAKSFGFNAVRFHSMTPPAEYFEAADEVGMLIMAELPAAYTQYFFAHRDFLKRELTSVLSSYRNNPSLLSLAFGNEFNLHWLKTDEDRKIFLSAINEFYKAAKELAPATLILSNDGFDMRPTDMVSLYRGSPPDRPTVRHEFGQYYCSLPDIGLIDKFTGVMVPEWLHAKKAWVQSSGLVEQYPEYLRNSQRLQQLGRKYQIERVRADPNVSGYHYWLIVDYPGGTGEGDSWEEGWLDYFWQPKGITPEQGREVNTPVLMMIDAGVDNRTMWAGEPKRVGIRLSNYGAEAIRGGQISWVLLDGAKTLSSGDVPAFNVGLGSVDAVGQIDINPGALTAARKLELVLTLKTSFGTHKNRWQFWAYPKPASKTPTIPVVSTVRLAAMQRAFPYLRIDAKGLTAESLLVTEALDATASAHLRAGGRVWLMLRQTPQMRGVEFFPASGGALGTLLASGHPALDVIPHEGFCDLQFYNLVHGAYALPLDGWPAGAGAIIGGIRTTSEFLSKTKNLSRVAYAAEGTVGNGKLLVTTLRLRENFDEAFPEAMTMVSALLNYASGTQFNPKAPIPAATLERLSGE